MGPPFLQLALLAIAACSRGTSSNGATTASTTATASAAAADPPASPGAALHANVLLEHPEQYNGKVVDVDVVEPLSGPATEAGRLGAEYAAYSVDVPDGNGNYLKLVPERFRLSDKDRYKLKFDAVVSPPIRVHAELLRDPEIVPTTYVLRVLEAKPIDLGSPVDLPSADAIGDDGRYDRKLVALHGRYRQAFEVSAIDDVWVSSGTYRAGAIPAPTTPGTFVGVLFASKGARYGHLGGYHAQLEEDRRP